MILPLSWLKDYVDIDVTPKELEEKLFSCGFEVEELIEVGKDISGVVVGQVFHRNPQGLGQFAQGVLPGNCPSRLVGGNRPAADPHCLRQLFLIEVGFDAQNPDFLSQFFHGAPPKEVCF